MAIRKPLRKLSRKSKLDPKVPLPLSIQDTYIDSVEANELKSPIMEYTEVKPGTDHWNPEERLCFGILFRALVDILGSKDKMDEALSWLLEFNESNPEEPTSWSFPWVCMVLRLPKEVFLSTAVLLKNKKYEINSLDSKKTDDPFIQMFGKQYGAVWREIDQAYKLHRGEYDLRQGKDTIPVTESFGADIPDVTVRVPKKRIRSISDRARSYLSGTTNDPDIRKRLRTGTKKN